MEIVICRFRVDEKRNTTISHLLYSRAVFKMLVRILNTLRSRIWDIVFFLFSDSSKSTVCQYGICQKKVLLQGMAEEKERKNGEV